MTDLNKFMVEAGVENNIVTGLVVSTEYTKRVRKILQPHLLKTVHGQTVAKWCLEYFDAFKEAPFKTIQQIFLDRKPELSETDAALVSIFLDRLSKLYVQESAYNVDYHVHQTLDFFRDREIEIRARNALALLQCNKGKEAEAELKKYQESSKEVSHWYDPFSMQSIAETFVNDNDRTMRIHGPLGELISGFEEGWTVLLPGGYKRGKTWWLIEFAVMALTQGLPVVFVSLEMNRKSINRRIYHRLTGYGNGDEAFILPTFDCLHNQKGECERPERTNRETLIDPNSKEKPEFSPELPYRPCSVCRQLFPQGYQLATWWTTYQTNTSFNMSSVADYFTDFTKYYGSLLRVICYPRFGVHVKDVIHDIEMLEYNEGFVGKLIIWDYPEITKPDQSTGSDWQDINKIWMQVASLSQQRNCIIIGPTQITTEGLDEQTLSERNIGRARQILGHVDVSISVNQTKKEKREGVSRLSVMMHRHEEFDSARQCMVLQHLSTGQVDLDSEIVMIGTR